VGPGLSAGEPALPGLTGPWVSPYPHWDPLKRVTGKA
jgi:hypothetical protein